MEFINKEEGELKWNSKVHGNMLTHPLPVRLSQKHVLGFPDTLIINLSSKVFNFNNK